MLANAKTFNSFAVDDLAKAQEFYGETLGLNVFEEEEGGISIKFDTGGTAYLYPKGDHEPASFTVLNLTVEDIDTAVEGLAANGIEFEQYDGEIETDESGIHRGSDTGKGPNIAWFKDPAGNILSVIEEK